MKEGKMRVNRTFSSIARRSAVSFVILFLLTLTFSFWPGAMTAGAQGPKGPVEITIGSTAGGTPDIMMRRMAKVLADEKIVEQPIVVVNRPGGSWTVGVNYVLGKKGADNVLLALSTSVLTTPIIQGKENNFDKIVPIAIFAQTDLMMVVQPDSPFNSLQDLVKASKEKPRSVKISGAQIGGSDSLAKGLLEKSANIQLNFIPYEGGGASAVAFLGRNVDGTFQTVDEGVTLIQSGKAKPLAILTEKRYTAKELKDVPTAREQGFDVVFAQNWGLAGPPGMDPALTKWWDDKLQKAVRTKAWKDLTAANFIRSEYIDSAKVPGALANQYQQYLQVLRHLGVAKK
jgi:putative tricarboxylic transport membrane protein